ncbi:transcription factor GTE4 [Canna indica]|uniref:Transcription factor GTE4 n=1 Tax=Canna indica TaxID=4628 RepID=A0AAQ3Q6R3_9LILI|nr:transcription factor GTE4 [Canna indica]
MDTGSPAADGPGDSVGESRRWSECKVYTRRRRNKKNNPPETVADNPQPSSHETLATTTTAELQSSFRPPPQPPPPVPAPPPQSDHRVSSDDEALSRHRYEKNAPKTASENPQISSLPPLDETATTTNHDSSLKQPPPSPQTHQRLSLDEEAASSRHSSKDNTPEQNAAENLQASSRELLATTMTAVDLHSLQQPPPVVPQPQHHQYISSGDEASSLNRVSQAVVASDCRVSVPHQNGYSEVKNDELPQQDVQEIRRKLVADLFRVRDLYKRLEARQLQLLVVPYSGAGGGSGAPSQHSVNHGTIPMVSKRVPAILEAVSATHAPFRPQLNVSVPSGLGARNYIGEPFMEKEKRTPKANQYFHSSDFILGKDKFPPPVSHKKSKSSKSKKHSVEESDYKTSSEKKIYANAFKSCRSLLEKLMKHKHGWVFNKPVDVEALGLYDYFSIIKHPMDLGTVKSRLTSNFYETPDEFAADVRLTFRNAMTYNPKGQDVHIMAEQLSNIFEERWVVIEADFTEHLHQLYVVNRKKAPPTDIRTLERSGSTVQPMVIDIKTDQSQHQHFGRPMALKKPKANDLNKRDMTMREKQTLSRHLQSLPPEKLDAVVQIINKNNSALNLHDDEIEVDIDSVDTETLWELDRFVTNYKKTLSKHKRKAELAMLAKAEAERRNQERLNRGEPDAAAAVVPQQTNNVDEKKVAAPLTVVGANNGDDVSGSSGSGPSSSDSGSSDSDSDSESSSSYESDAARSPGT